MTSAANEQLPGIKTAGSPILKKTKTPSKQNNEIMSVCFSPDILSPHSSDKFPPVVLKKVGNQRTGYGSRTAAYGTPEVVKRIFTGQMPATYFNDICYGRKATPRDLSYKSPTTERAEHLWDPKRIERVKARHKIRDIQDARFRRRDTLEEISINKGRMQRRKTEHCLLTNSETIPSGKQAFLLRVQKEEEKYQLKCLQNRKSRPAKKVAPTNFYIY